MSIKRNPNIKYVKAEVFRKHERIRDQEFEDKIWELFSFNKEAKESVDQPFNLEKSNSNFQRNLLENSKGIESLEESDEEDLNPPNNEDFVIARHYGSYDEEDNLDSVYSSMKGDTLSGDFDLEIVGNKIDIPKVNALEVISQDITPNFNNASRMGSKKTFGEPSGDVFGLILENQYTGIFGNDDNHEFQPVNTLHSE